LQCFLGYFECFSWIVFTVFDLYALLLALRGLASGLVFSLLWLLRVRSEIVVFLLVLLDSIVSTSMSSSLVVYGVGSMMSS